MTAKLFNSTDEIIRGIKRDSGPDIRRAADRSEFPGGELVKMVTDGWTAEVVRGIEKAITRSFATDGLIRPVRTQHEIKRRFQICVDGFRMMRRDLDWAVPRIVDALPEYLRKTLDRDNWEPPPEGRQSWIEAGRERAAVLDGADMAPEATEIDGIETAGVG